MMVVMRMKMKIERTLSARTVVAVAGVFVGGGDAAAGAGAGAGRGWCEQLYTWLLAIVVDGSISRSRDSGVLFEIAFRFWIFLI